MLMNFLWSDYSIICCIYYFFNKKFTQLKWIFTAFLWGQIYLFHFSNVFIKIINNRFKNSMCEYFSTKSLVYLLLSNGILKNISFNCGLVL